MIDLHKQIEQKAIQAYKKRIAKKIVLLAKHNHIFEESKCCFAYVRIEPDMKLRCSKCKRLLNPYDIRCNAEQIAGRNEAVASVLEILV